MLKGAISVLISYCVILSMLEPQNYTVLERNTFRIKCQKADGIVIDGKCFVGDYEAPII